MNKLLAQWSAAGLVLLAGCGDSGAPEPGTGTGVDLVLIVIDTLRADAVLDPEGRYDTPNLDRLARDGIVFPRAFSHAPMTLPAHTALFSSRLPVETTVTNNGMSVPEDLPLLTEWLHQGGYGTRAVISLATLDQLKGKASVRRGFDAYDAGFMGMAAADATAARLLTSLDHRDTGKPLFLFAHYADPHEPYNAHGTEQNQAAFTLNGVAQEPLPTSDETQWDRKVRLEPGKSAFEFRSAEDFRMRMFEVWDGGHALETIWEEGDPGKATQSARVVVDRKDARAAECEVKFWLNDIPRNIPDRYRQEVAYVDRYVGELVKKLEELGLYQESLVVFTSDHGEALGEHKTFGHVEGLTDDQIHVPLIIKLPAGDPRASELARAAERVVSHMDVVPTVLQLLGLRPLPGQRGVSILEAHAAVHCAETHRPEASKDKFALRDERFKMIYIASEDRCQMFDLTRDPGENQDVFEAQKGERPDWPERLRALYQASSANPGEAGVRDEALQRELEALGYGGKN